MPDDVMTVRVTVQVPIWRFREKLLWRMAELQLTQVGLAELCDVSPKSLAVAVNGPSMSEEWLRRLSRALDVPMSYWGAGFRVPHSPARAARKKLYAESAKRVGEPLKKNER